MPGVSLVSDDTYEINEINELNELHELVNLNLSTYCTPHFNWLMPAPFGFTIFAPGEFMLDEHMRQSLGVGLQMDDRKLAN